MQYSEVQNLFKSLNLIMKKLKQVKKPIEDIIIKMVDQKQITGYKTSYVFDQTIKMYIFMITCDNTFPVFGKSKSFVESRTMAHKLLLHNINNTISCELKNEKYTNEELHDRINKPLENTKASEKEKDEEEFQLSDSKKDETKLEDLNAELDLYHSIRDNLKFDYNENEKIISFGRKQYLSRVYACDLCGRTKQKDEICLHGKLLNEKGHLIVA